MPGIDIEAIKVSIEAQAQAINSSAELESLRVQYLGRKGVLAQLTGAIPGMPVEERAVFGRQVNALKNRITELIEQKQKVLELQAGPQDYTHVDMGMPGLAQEIGRIHPLTQVIDEICGIFTAMGFSVVEGPEIETEFNNFTGLNIPLDHPSRDAFDTFYIKCAGIPVSRLAGSAGSPAHRLTGKLLLRSHTSPVQIRTMKAHKPPLAVVVPGRVYRPDAVDASHSFMFHQIEGFVVDTQIRFSDLKGALTHFAQGVFGKDIRMRFRPHFFPFTEPSVEVDVSCVMCQSVKVSKCQQRRCSVCGGKGWLEILGAGMIHPSVFKHVGYDPKKYSGFAFGMGVERIAMLKYGINDIRLFFENDRRFLEQF